MEIFLYKKKLNRKLRKYKQNCSKQKITNVSSANECQKIDTFSRARKTDHMTSRQNVPGRPKIQDGVQTVKSHGIWNGYYIMYGTRIVSVLLRRTQ